MRRHAQRMPRARPASVLLVAAVRITLAAQAVRRVALAVLRALVVRPVVVVRVAAVVRRAAVARLAAAADGVRLLLAEASWPRTIKERPARKDRPFFCA